MLVIEKAVYPSVEQMAFVVEAMRNAWNSWDKSDTEFEEMNDAEWSSDKGIILGNEDKRVMTNLSKGRGSDRKFLRQMPVGLRITAPMYWWKEFDTYKVGTVRNSCSTMHTIASRKFSRADFSLEHLLPESMEKLTDTIHQLNKMRDMYINFDAKLGGTYGIEKKDIWWQMIELLPSSYNQTANVSLNYEVLRAMYNDRAGHKLDEWLIFRNYVEMMPYSWLITGKEENGNVDSEVVNSSISNDTNISNS